MNEQNKMREAEAEAEAERELEKASRQYEQYLQLTQVTELVAATSDTTWVHNPNTPLTLVLNK